MSETCQKLAFTHPIVVLKSGLKNNWMKKLDHVNRPSETNFSPVCKFEELSLCKQFDVGYVRITG